MNDNEELKIVDIEILISIIVAGAVIASALVSYNSHLKLTGKKPFWTNKEIRNIAIINKIIILIVSIISFGLAIKDIEDLKAENKNLEDAYIIAIASFLFVVSAILLLIVSLRNNVSNEEIISDDFIL